MSQVLTPKAESHSADFDLASARGFPKGCADCFSLVFGNFLLLDTRLLCRAQYAEAMASWAALESQFPAVTAIMAIV